MDGNLFTWQHGDIVLIAYLDGVEVVLTRGWREADRYQHIREWRFTNHIRFLGQMRRLVRHTTGSDETGMEVTRLASQWLTEQSGRH